MSNTNENYVKPNLKRGKPSFLRFMAKTCNDFAKSCRMEEVTSSIVSPKPLIEKSDTRFVDGIYETVFDEKPLGENDGLRHPNVTNKIEMEQCDMDMMENYKKLNPFIIGTPETRCVVCGRLICMNYNFLVEFGCRGCTNRIYCSSHCFGLDWPIHIKFCIPGQVDFLTQFFFNRIKFHKNLSHHLKKIAEVGYSNLGRGSIVIIFEQIESLKIFLKYNHDFSLEYYYTVQYISISSIVDNFKLFSNFSLMSSIVKTYNTDTQLPVILIIKNSISNLVAETVEPFHDITVLYKGEVVQQHVFLSMEAIFKSSKKLLNRLLNSSKWDFRTRRIICKSLTKISCYFGVHNNQFQEWVEILKIYFLKGEFRIQVIEIKNLEDVEDSDISKKTSLV